MAGFASLIGGLGQAAGQYGEAARNRQMQQWGIIQNHLADLIGKARDSAFTPERQVELDALRSKVLNLRPGQDPSKIMQDVQEHLTLHPTAASALTPTPPPPNPPGPGVAGTYKSAGLGPQQNMSPVGGATPIAGMSGLIAGGAAQPSASPVQPQAQQATAQQQPQSQQAPTQQQMQGQVSPQGHTTITPLAGTPPQSSPMSDVGSRVLDAYSHAMQSGVMPSNLSAAAQPFITNEAEYSRSQRLAQMEMGWKQSALKEYMASPEWKQVPSMLQGQWRLWASTPGQNMPQMGYGMSAILNPFTQSTTAANLEAQHPGILAQYHIDPAVTPNVIVTRSRYGMSMGDDTPTMVAPEPPKFTTITNSDNSRSVIPNVPGSAGVAPSQAAPTLRGIDTTTGSPAFTSPADVEAGRPDHSINLIPNGLVPKERTSTSTPTMEGGTVSSQVTRPVLSNSVPTKGVATTSTPVPKGTGSVWSSVAPFNDATPLDHIVKSIAQDAANEKMISTRGPFSDQNPNKAMVNKRMAQLGLDPNNVSGSIRDRAMTARTVLPHLDDVGRLIDQAEADGDIGIVMSRINQFFNNEIGVDPTKLVVGPDNTKHKILSELLTNLAFTSSAVGMVHGGVRAGSSLPMIEHWSSVLGAKDPNTLRSQLGVTRKWVDGYSQMAGETKPLPGITPLPGAASGRAGGGGQQGGTVQPLTSPAKTAEEYLSKHKK